MLTHSAHPKHSNKNKEIYYTSKPTPPPPPPKKIQQQQTLPNAQGNSRLDMFLFTWILVCVKDTIVIHKIVSTILLHNQNKWASSHNV